MHIFFSVGEPSGDQHAALLIEELRRRRPEVRITGFGGPRMEQAGCQLLFPLTNLAVMGIFGVLPKLWQFYQQARRARAYLAMHRPEMVVLIDFPGFNWHIAKAAKSLGIPVIYYLPPQLWAWAPWRVKKVHKYVDLVLSGLPFEAEWYAQRGAKVLYVGHPFFDEVDRHALDAAFLKEWTPETGATVALLPGSRAGEVSSCWPLMLEAACRLAERHPQTQFLVANYKDSQRVQCRDHYQELGLRLPLAFFVGKTQEIIQLADCAIMVSGSVSLELLARSTPATVLYRCSRLTYLIGRALVTCKFFSLPNLIAGRMVMPEHLSVGSPEPVVRALVQDVDRWLSNAAALDQARVDLETVRRQVHATGATRRVAEVLLARLPVAEQRAAA